MTPLERRSVAALAGIFSTRLLGMFLILPVFTLYADTLHGYTPFLAGLAIGIYGLVQAIFQIPFGVLSDRLGRRPIITVGLLVFAGGSVVAALSDTMLGVIIGRALQGGGAVSAAVVAMTADLTRESQRTKAMAVIGITVGASFLISILLGSALNALIGVPGIFWLTSLLALFGIGILWFAVPAPPDDGIRNAGPLRQHLRGVLRNAELARLNVGIFVLHAVLTAVFVVIPHVLVDFAGLPQGEHSAFYLPVMLLSAVPLFPIISASERRGLQRAVFAAAVFVLGAALAALWWHHSTLMGVAVGLFVFFVAFNLLEAQLPSFVSKAAPPAAKGAAIGVYSTLQFFGLFVGGVFGGWIHGAFGLGAVFAASALLTVPWFLLVAFSRPLSPRLHSRSS
jgi:predicted MFS family arabinose efflux permease